MKYLFLEHGKSLVLLLILRYRSVRFQVARDYRFDNVGSSFLTLFYLLTLEGWLECRDLFDSRNTTLAQNANLVSKGLSCTSDFISISLFSTCRSTCTRTCSWPSTWCCNYCWALLSIISMNTRLGIPFCCRHSRADGPNCCRG